MATLVPVPQAAVVPQGGGRWAHWTTPEILVRGRLFLIALEVLLLVVVVTGTQVHREVMQHVGNTTAKGIIAAEQVRMELADMDADAADELLAPGDSKASGLFDEHRVLATKGMIDAAENLAVLNLGSSQVERTPLETLQVGLGNYERMVQEALDYQEAGQPEAAVRYYRAAAIIMDGTLLPAADALDTANNDLLESRYESQSSLALLARTAVLLVGLATVLALFVAQVFLSRRMRRTVNPLLLGATVLTLLVTVGSFAAMTREGSELRLAKEDAFSSIRTLLRARATAYAANSDESRYLLDPAHKAESEGDFRTKMDALAHFPAGMNPDLVMPSVNNGRHLDGFTGLLADEMNGFLFPGERDAAINTVAALLEYQRIDGRIRQLERAGRHDEAIALDTGRQEGQSNWAFDRLDAALGDALGINQREFDRAVAEGLHALDRLEPEAGVAAVLCVLLIFFGLAPRIREYV